MVGRCSILLLGGLAAACGDDGGGGLQEPREVASVAVAGPATLEPGGSAQFTATARDEAGATLEERTFVWASSAAAVATVSESGVVTAIAEGTVEIRATAEGVTGSSTVEVVPASSLDLALEEVASGLDSPLYLTSPPGDQRLFIVEKTGRVRVVRDGGLLEAPFLDLSSSVSDGAEQGLLGLAFPPDYPSTGRFVVHYTNLAGDTRVSQFTVSADPDRADAGSERVLLAVGQPGPAHNGGQILFGPDGYLYIGLGDGRSHEGDDEGRGQSLEDLLGGILRIDVSSATDYTVPADNPFVGTAGARPEIWSYGLRNPWRFSFDRATGDLYIADVGESKWEEIDYAAALDGSGRGVNYGWSRMEGPDCVGDPGCDREGLALPALAYDHGEGCSIVGGYVYRGAAIPRLQGTYFYSDFCRGWVRSVKVSGGSAREETDWPALSPGGQVLSFGEDSAGELYILAGDGRVVRIVAAEDLSRGGGRSGIASRPRTDSSRSSRTTLAGRDFHGARR